MSPNSCCHTESTRVRKNSPIRRVSAAIARWVVPTTVLALLPKCPMCLAAYLALATGTSISLSAATWLRTGLLIACVGALAWLSIGTVARALHLRRLSLPSMTR